MITLGFTVWLMGCATPPPEPRIDNLPMYGQPDLQRPEFLKKADEAFIAKAAEGLGGREAASKAWSEQADQFMRQGNLDYAMRRYNQAWLLNPNNYQPYWGFGRVLLERDKIDEAIVHLEKAISLCHDAYQKVALLSDTGTAYTYKAASISESMSVERARFFKMANNKFEESTRLDPNDANAWMRWAYALFLEGDYEGSWMKVKKAQSLGATGIDAIVKKLSEKMPQPQ